MKKQDIKNILIAMRTPENGNRIDTLLGKIDGMDDKQILEAVQKVGDTQEDIRSFFVRKLSEKQHNRTTKTSSD